MSGKLSVALENADKALAERNNWRWPAILREDGRRVEIICPHGCGHPVKSLSKNWDDSWMGIHGCCGCCSLAAFHLAEIHHLRIRDEGKA